MSYRVRRVKTASNKIAVQVYIIENRKRKILKHIGSSNDEKELTSLLDQANNWIQEHAQTRSMFPEDNTDSYFKNYKYQSFNYTYAYDFLSDVIKTFNFDKHINKILFDLIISQILEPTSKRQNILNLEKYFGIRHNLNLLYKQYSQFDENLKDEIEKEVVAIAKKEYNFDFSFVLYDVTTLYFESFKNDEFKTPGFSKDHKHNQPQVVIGLMVTREGFPVHYEVFKGNTCESKTFLPSVLHFKEKHQIENITVIADSAMLSKQILTDLIENNINYIISARLASLKQDQIDVIDRNIKRIDGHTFKLEDIIIEYREKRYRKDLADMHKQIEKAKNFEGVKTSKITKLKFLKNDKVTYSVNEDLVSKTKKLLGLKGYVTNLDKTNEEVVSYYKTLVNVEHAFRIAKSDLEIRPIYHYKENTIKNHILLCFMCLALCVYLEIKNKLSINQIVKILKSVTDAKILNVKTGKVLIDRNLPETGLLH